MSIRSWMWSTGTSSSAQAALCEQRCEGQAADAVHPWVRNERIDDLSRQHHARTILSMTTFCDVLRFPELWYSWRHQLTEFQQDYHVAAFDMRGYGASEKPQVPWQCANIRRIATLIAQLCAAH
jgi:hypothetical protein